MRYQLASSRSVRSGDAATGRHPSFLFVMAQTAQDVLRQIHEEGIELIDLKFVDLHGKWQHLTVCRDLID